MILAEFTSGVDNIQVEKLYQWDTYQQLNISGIDFGSVAPEIHFCNKKSEVALAVSGTLNGNGSVTVSIPNSLLTEPYDIAAYLYLKTATSGNTIKCIVIPITARPKPSDYVLTTDDDIAEILEIELEAKAIIDGLTAREYSSTESYKRPNIVYYENGSYMCKSSVSITGIDPTNTTYWQLLCKGTSIKGISLSADNKLTFTLDNGMTVDIPVETAGVTTDYFSKARAVVKISLTENTYELTGTYTATLSQNLYDYHYVNERPTFVELLVGTNKYHLPLTSFSYTGGMATGSCTYVFESADYKVTISTPYTLSGTTMTFGDPTITPRKKTLWSGVLSATVAAGNGSAGGINIPFESDIFTMKKLEFGFRTDNQLGGVQYATAMVTPDTESSVELFNGRYMHVSAFKQSDTVLRVIFRNTSDDCTTETTVQVLSIKDVG